MKKILVITLAGIGDTLMATPVIHELKAQYPEAEIHALTMWAGARDVLIGNPHLAQVHQHLFIQAGKWSSLRFVAGLRRMHFDVSLNFHPQGRREYRWIAWLIGARARLSHAYENQNWIDRLLMTRSAPQDYAAHCVENNLRLADLLGRPRALAEHRYELFLSSSERAWAEEYFRGAIPAGCQALAAHVGSGGTKNLALRRWPVERYAALFQRALDEHPSLRILALGGPDEEGAHAQLAAMISNPRFHIPATPTLRIAAALLERCDAFLSVDTVFMHLAAAVRVPKQFVIQTPTLNPPVHPRREDWVLIPNPAVGERALDWYRYDGRPIRGGAGEIRRAMESVTVESVWDRVRLALS